MSGEAESTERRRIAWILLLLVVATAAKCAWAATSIGTTDTVRFFHFGEALLKHPIAEVYASDPRWNQTLTVSLCMRLLAWLTHDNGTAFVFCFRLPGILADIAIVVELLLLRRRFALAWHWLALAAVSPLHLLICGFHGNIDGVVAARIFLAFSAAVRGSALLSGLWLGLACHVKIAPVLLAPALAAFWLVNGQAVRLAVAFGLTAGAMIVTGWWVAGMAFVRHVLAYGSVWGAWGISESLVALGLTHPQVPLADYTDLVAARLAPVLKALIVGIAIWLGWIGRRGDVRALVRTGAATLLVFFALTPGFGHQYLVWWFGMVLVAAPGWAGALTIASAVTVFIVFSSGTSDPFPWRIVEPQLPLKGAVLVVSQATWLMFVAAAVFMVKSCMKNALTRPLTTTSV